MEETNHCVGFEGLTTVVMKKYYLLGYNVV
jgi:hypothetical protein